MNIKKILQPVIVAAICVISLPAMADDAAALLAKMRSAMHTLNYSGTLVYAQGNDLSTYQIRHSNEAGAEKESVISLEQANGQREAESFSLARFQQMQPQMEKAYSLDFGGNESVANRSCRIVVARPRDRMRYLQRYCIDPASGMLLKYALVNPAHQAVEQMLFTSLEIVAGAEQAVSPMVKSTVTEEPETAEESEEDDGGWTFGSLPAGFQQTNSLLQPVTDDDTPVRQLVLSDGMTSISVFIAPVGSKAQPDATLSSGAMNIFTRKLGKYDVTLVGEVPVATLEGVAKGLRHAD